MKILCQVDQAECFRRGIDAASSTIKINIDPSKVPYDIREFIAKHLIDGHILRSSEEFRLNGLGIPAFFETILWAMEYHKAKEKAQENWKALFYREWLDKMDIPEFGPLSDEIEERAKGFSEAQGEKAQTSNIG